MKDEAHQMLADAKKSARQRALALAQKAQEHISASSPQDLIEFLLQAGDPTAFFLAPVDPTKLITKLTVIRQKLEELSKVRQEIDKADIALGESERMAAEAIAILNRIKEQPHD